MASDGDNVEIPPGTVIEFLTDVEGNWDYFVHFVSLSQVLYWDGETRGVWGPGTLRMRPNGMLVFGGDAGDKGPGDIRFTKILLALKKENPSRVFMLIGNRDLTKLRFWAELQDGEEHNPWIPGWEARPKLYDTFLDERKLERGLVSKLHWIFQHCGTGCQDTTFSTRKEELALLHLPASDEDVVRSYRDSVDPHGQDAWALEYLRQGLIGLVLGDTLFLHAGLPDEVAGVVPNKAEACENVHEWVVQLNKWKDQELQDFVEQPCWRRTDSALHRGGSGLIEYGTPHAGSKTVIYHNPFVDGNPVQRSPKVQKFLQSSSIQRLITGHQPHGQAPTVVRHPETGLLVITADTSRSDSQGCKLFNPANNRGNVASMVRIHDDCVHIEGVFNDGRKHRCKLHTDPEKDMLPDALVGRQLVSGSWVKTIVDREDHKRERVVTAFGHGYNVVVEEMTREKAMLQLTMEYNHNGTYVVPIKHIKATSLKEGILIKEDSVEPEDWSDQRKCRSFEYDPEAFDSADTYILTLHSVVDDPATDSGKKMIDRINGMIKAGKRVIFITNDSTLSRAQLREKIFKYNIDLKGVVHPERTQQLARHMSDDERQEFLLNQTVLSSSTTCAWYLKHKDIRRPFVICSGTGLLEELRAAGITDYVATTNEDGETKPEFLRPLTNENVQDIIASAGNVDAVVVGWALGLTALTIAVAVQYVKWNEDPEDGDASPHTPCSTGARAIPIVACSLDAAGILGHTPSDFRCPEFQNRKVRAVGNGTMAWAVCNCLGERYEPIDVGKPSRMLLERLKRAPDEGGLGVNFRSTVVVGSTLRTDILLANRAGMRSLLVLSGITSEEELDREEESALLPTWVLDSFEKA